jgi:hypothetical protein
MTLSRKWRWRNLRAQTRDRTSSRQGRRTQ